MTDCCGVLGIGVWQWLLLPPTFKPPTTVGAKEKGDCPAFELEGQLATFVILNFDGGLLYPKILLETYQIIHFRKISFFFFPIAGENRA